MKRFLAPLPLLMLTPAAQADISAQNVLDLMRFDEFVWVLRIESLADNADLPQAFLGVEPSPTWEQTLQDVLVEADMLADIETVFLANLTDDALPEIYDFLQTDAWQQAITLELSAREAWLDEFVEEAAVENYYDALDDGDARIEVLNDLIVAGDLVESNVVGTFNTMFSFYQGLGAGGLELGLNEEQLLETILQEEDSIRNDVNEWLYSFLLMAYDPLSDEDLEAQIDFLSTPAGQTLNNAMFTAFDALYTNLTFDLGQALALAAMEQTL